MSRPSARRRLSSGSTLTKIARSHAFRSSGRRRKTPSNTSTASSEAILTGSSTGESVRKSKTAEQ
jgi:hypothetical protein